MKLNYDYEHEVLDSSMRSYDKEKCCLFLDCAGYNETQSIIDSHWHEWLEIIYVIDGTIDLIYPGGVLKVESGEVAVIGTQVLHKIIGYTGHFRFQCLHINIGFALEYVSLINLKDIVFVIENNQEFLFYFSNIISLIKHNDIASELKYKSSLLAILSICLDNNEKKEIDYNYNDTFLQIILYISEHYKERLSLNQLSSHFNYTSQYISSLFKKYLNTTYSSYLTKLRLDRAKFLLQTSNMRIIDIAYDCGFSSEHTFIHQFKKNVNDTPTRYRKLQKEEKIQ